MSFELEANPNGLRGAFPHLSVKGFQRLGESGNFLRLICARAQRKLRSQNLKLEICRELPSTRAGDPTHQNTRQKLRDSATNDK